MNLYAEKYGITPGNVNAADFESMLEQIKNTDGEKTLIFSKGRYYVDASKLKSRMFYITNTVGDNEFNENETPHKNRAMIYLDGVKNLTVEGNGASFFAVGKCTNMALENCENVVIKNLSLSAVRPDLHELKAVKAEPFCVDFEIDAQSEYVCENGRLYFVGNDYRTPVDKQARSASWIGFVREKTPNNIKRVNHPLMTALKYELTADGNLRVYYPVASRFKVGDRFYLYDVRRQYVGIFLNRCKNITLDTVVQRFNYSLAVVAQDCETLTFSRLDFSPDSDSDIKMASLADFLQICMCRGDVKILDSNFCGAGDDCLNVHGVHFKIKNHNGRKVTVGFMHPQTHGFNPLREGDTIAFVSSSDLLECGSAKIVSSRLVSEYDIALTLDTENIPSKADVIEDVSACPDLTFDGNTLDRIITRGVLLTSRGKCLIRNNRFVSCSMSAVLLSDDAKSWYESGMCRDVLIENNIFVRSGQTPVLIKPENSVHNGAVHKNIIIRGNTFAKYRGYCIKAKSADNIIIESNSFSSGKVIKTRDCENVVINANK